MLVFSLFYELSIKMVAMATRTDSKTKYKAVSMATNAWAQVDKSCYDNDLFKDCTSCHGNHQPPYPSKIISPWQLSFGLITMTDVVYAITERSSKEEQLS